MVQSRTVATLAAVVAAAATGCSSTTTGGGQAVTSSAPASPATPSWSTATPSGPAVTPSASTASPVQDTPTAPSPTAAVASGQAGAGSMACAKPSRALLDRIAADIDQHPGPVTAGAMVRAAETSTGTWYAVAVERGRVSESDGRSIPGRTIGVGLTNIPDYRDAPRLIPLGDTTTGTAPTLSWQHVTWTGERLQVGKQAAAKALSCIGH